MSHLYFFLAQKASLRQKCQSVLAKILNEVVWLSREYFLMLFIKKKSEQWQKIWVLYLYYHYLLVRLNANVYIRDIFLYICVTCVLQGLIQVAVATFFFHSNTELDWQDHLRVIPVSCFSNNTLNFRNDHSMNRLILCILTSKMQLKVTKPSIFSQIAIKRFQFHLKMELATVFQLNALVQFVRLQKIPEYSVWNKSQLKWSSFVFIYDFTCSFLLLLLHLCTQYLLTFVQIIPISVFGSDLHSRRNGGHGFTC